MCGDEHPLWLVAEGYGYCVREDGPFFYAWKLGGEPAGGSFRGPNPLWREAPLVGDGAWAWVTESRSTLCDVLEVIQADIEACRGQSVAPVKGPTYTDWLAEVSA